MLAGDTPWFQVVYRHKRMRKRRLQFWLFKRIGKSSIALSAAQDGILAAVTCLYGRWNSRINHLNLRIPEISLDQEKSKVPIWLPTGRFAFWSTHFSMLLPAVQIMPLSGFAASSAFWPLRGPCLNFDMIGSRLRVPHHLSTKTKWSSRPMPPERSKLHGSPGPNRKLSSFELVVPVLV